MTPADTRWRVACAGALALLTSYAGQHNAFADGTARGSVAVVSQADGSARLLFSAQGLPTAASIDPASVRVEIDGAPTTAVATMAGSTASGRVVRRVLLVFDTSGSMAGEGIAGARTAALAFADSVPADVKVGLVAFADRAQLVVAPTRSRDTLTNAVTRLRAHGKTSLYDGVARGLAVLGTSGVRGMVVLSDGADTRSSLSLAAVTDRLKRTGVHMDAVALHTAHPVAATLQQMATVTGGQVTAASSAADLASTFSAAARTFASQVVVDVAIPGSYRGRTANVDVTVPSSVGSLHARTVLRVTAAPLAAEPRNVAAPPSHARGLPLGLSVLIFLGLFAPVLFVLVALETRRSPQARTRRLLDRYTLTRAATGEAQPEAATGLSRAAARLMAVTDRVAAKPARRDKLIARLTRADVALTPGEWLAVQSLIAFTTGALGTLLFASLVVGLLLGTVGFLASGSWLSLKGRRRLRAFEEHLPSALQLVASSLRSGFSLAQALDSAVREGVDPIATELNRALGEARLGKSLEDALEGIGERMDSTDFGWVVMTIRIQREVGGNLAEILLNTSGVMRERARLRRQVKALSAEGRLSAYVLIALPILMSLYMVTLRRTYIRPLYTTGLGVGMLVFGVLLVVMGTLWMRKVVTVVV